MGISDNRNKTTSKIREKTQIIYEKLIFLIQNYDNNKINYKTIREYLQDSIMELDGINKYLTHLMEIEIKTNYIPSPEPKTITGTVNRNEKEEEFQNNYNQVKPLEDVQPADNSTNVRKEPINQNPIPVSNRIQIFFSVPELDGSFLNFDGKHYADNKTVFVFTLKESELAEASFIQDENLQKKAINAYETYLEKVTDDKEMTFSTAATKIIVTKPGEFALNGNRWEIKRKIEVKFE
ncbi:hypothetical protein IH575_03675 [Candidatus Dojkabacteria bacterium]|nr:hypothetical protein [Candidatus Dojkabacteria bacterium]